MSKLREFFSIFSEILQISITRRINIIFRETPNLRSGNHMPSRNATDQEIRDILKTYKTVAVIGMSKSPEKEAYRIPEYLMKNGYRVIPVNPSAEEIQGQRSYKRLIDVPGEVDIVDVFRPSEDIPNYVEDVIKKKPKVFWEQLGIHNPAAEEKVESAGIKVVYDRCMLQEHRRISNR
jgi:uncharacterized protein